MSNPMTQWVADLKPLVADDATKLTDPDDFEAAVTAAVEVYSKHRPLVDYEEYTGDGSTYDLALPPNWDDEFSQVLSVEYPTGERPQSFLDAIDWKVIVKMVSDVATKFVRLVNHTPTASEKVLVTYTRLHQVVNAESGADTPPTADKKAVVALAASKACLVLAAKHADEKTTVYEADSVDHGSVGDKFRRLAKAYREEFERHLGIGQKGSTSAAGATMDLDVATQAPRLFRGPRTR